MRIGYFLSCEEYTPQQLVEQARLAEEAGFEALWISDHFHPWNDNQGQHQQRDRDRDDRVHEREQAVQVALPPVRAWAHPGRLAAVRPGQHRLSGSV
jgi:alkanesulfonate monooxygenase SsuD/methylene tetrahydromethanopterin reductase-like flavin-dependent oxidoreductase (luciferase family)